MLPLGHRFTDFQRFLNYYKKLKEATNKFLISSILQNFMILQKTLEPMSAT